MSELLTERTTRVNLAVVALIAVSTALVAHSYIGFFSRFASDDYCTAGIVEKHGFFGAQKYWFTQWSGRFSFTAAISLAHSIGGSKLPPFIPGILIVCWVITSTWALAPIIAIAFPTGVITGPFLLAEIIIASTLATTPTIYESLYWETGATTYIAPLILLAIFVGLLLRPTLSESMPRTVMVISAGLTFVAGGFSETYAALQMCGLALGIVACVARRQISRKVMSVLVAGFAGSILSAAVFLVAPGNEARIATSAAETINEPPKSWLALIQLSIRFAIDSILGSVWASRPTNALALVLPAVLVSKMERRGVTRSSETSIRDKKIKTWLVFSPIVGFVLIMASFAPTAYIAAYVREGYRPQPRLVVTANFVFFSVACISSYLIGVFLRTSSSTGQSLALRRVGQLLGFIVLPLLLIPFNNARRTLALAPTVRAYAAGWDAQDRDIRAAKIEGLSQLQVHAVSSTSRNSRGNFYFGLRLMDSTPGNWVNGCAAEYYGVESINAQ